MGHCIVKVTQDPADDRYLLWSTEVDNFTEFGTRKQLRKHLRRVWGTNTTQRIDQMFDQANERGSSTGVGTFLWDSEPEMVMNVHDVTEDLPEGQHHALPRPALSEFFDRYANWEQAEGDEETPEPSYLDLLVVIDDWGRQVSP